MLRYIFLFIYLVIAICRLPAQYKTEYYPVQFSQYTQCYSLINPASICQRGAFEADLGYKKYISGFDNISTFYASIGIRPLGHAKTKPNNAFGVRFDSDKEGNYIRRTRMYAMYAYHAQIANKVYISAGIDFGFFNMSIKGTPSTGNVSTFIPDADAGIWVWGKSYRLGVSLNQLFRGSLKPIEDEINLPVHSNFIAAKSFSIFRNITVTPSVLVRYPFNDGYNADYSLECAFKPITGGISIRREQGIAFFAGLNEIKVFKGYLDFSLSYNSPLSGSTTKISTFELALKYYSKLFNKK